MLNFRNDTKDIIESVNDMFMHIEAGISAFTVKTEFGRILVSVEAAISPVKALPASDVPFSVMAELEGYRNAFDYYVRIDARKKQAARTYTLCALGMSSVIAMDVLGVHTPAYDSKQVMFIADMIIDFYGIKFSDPYKPDRYMFASQMARAGVIDRISSGYQRMVMDKIDDQIDEYRNRIIRYSDYIKSHHNCWIDIDGSLAMTLRFNKMFISIAKAALAENLSYTGTYNIDEINCYIDHVIGSKESLNFKEFLIGLIAAAKAPINIKKESEPEKKDESGEPEKKKGKK